MILLALLLQIHGHATRAAIGAPPVQEGGRGTDPIRFDVVHPLPAIVPPGQPTPVLIKIINGDEEEVIPTSATLHYRRGSGGFVTEPMPYLGDGVYSLPLPAAPCEAAIEYFLSVMGDEGSVVYLPASAPTETFTADATVLYALFDDDFEGDPDDNAGWTKVCEDTTDEAGCWTRVIPIGTQTGGAVRIQAQPGEDYTPDPGVMCYVTGQPNQVGDPEWSTDVDDGPMELTSPVIGLSSSNVRVRYARWFVSRTNNVPGDDELIVELSRDEGANWVEVERVAYTGAWTEHSFHLDDFPEASGNQLQIRFTTADFGEPSLTEAAIDDVLVGLVFCASSKGDYDGDGFSGLVDLRNLNGCLTGPAEGATDDWCAIFDFDGDGLVDLGDFSEFQLHFGYVRR